MAGDARTCKRGHLRTPENIDSYRSCKACKHLRDISPELALSRRAEKARYVISPAARASQARYRAAIKGWEAKRRYQLKGVREVIAGKLDALAKEEAECRQTLSELLTRTK